GEFHMGYFLQFVKSGSYLHVFKLETHRPVKNTLPAYAREIQGKAKHENSDGHASALTPHRSFAEWYCFFHVGYLVFIFHLFLHVRKIDLNTPVQLNR